MIISESNWRVPSAMAILEMEEFHINSSSRYENNKLFRDKKVQSKIENESFPATFSSPLRDMSKPRVLIVGATGRTGGAIVDALLEAGQTVRNSYPQTHRTQKCTNAIFPGSRSLYQAHIGRKTRRLEAPRARYQNPCRRARKRCPARWYPIWHPHSYQRSRPRARGTARTDPARGRSEESRCPAIRALRLDDCLSCWGCHVAAWSSMCSLHQTS
jgi:hypothetical protein